MYIPNKCKSYQTKQNLALIVKVILKDILQLADIITSTLHVKTKLLHNF